MLVTEKFLNDKIHRSQIFIINCVPTPFALQEKKSCKQGPRQLTSVPRGRAPEHPSQRCQLGG